MTFPGAYGQREVMLMELAIQIALAALVVDVIDTVFTIVWSIYIERKHNKKRKVTANCFPKPFGHFLLIVF